MKHLFQIALLSALLIGLSSCEKDDPKPEKAPQAQCEVNDYGYFALSNNYSDDYKLYIDDELVQVVPGHTTMGVIQLSSGYHVMRAVQNEGFIFFPTEHTGTFLIEQCEVFATTIP